MELTRLPLAVKNPENEILHMLLQLGYFEVYFYECVILGSPFLGFCISFLMYVL